jgi:hypothetical protein
MKDFFKKLKKNFGLEEEEEQPRKTDVPSPETPAPTVQVQQPVKADSPLPSAHVKREEIIRFIIDALQPYVDERSVSVEVLKLYVLCNTPEEEELAGIALYKQKPGFFREQELERKLLNNYVQLAKNWSFRFFLVTGSLPDCKFKQGPLGLQVFTEAEKELNYSPARISVLTGQAEQEEYLLDPVHKMKYFIGRGKNPTLPSGRRHTNDIVFLGKDEEGFDEAKGKSNLFVSRNHAIISFNPERNRYYLYADQGGLPENGNKTKLFKSNDRTERIDIPGVAHELENGDQIELGGDAKLLFST